LEKTGGRYWYPIVILLLIWKMACHSEPQLGPQFATGARLKNK